MIGKELIPDNVAIRRVSDASMNLIGYEMSNIEVFGKVTAYSRVSLMTSSPFSNCQNFSISSFVYLMGLDYAEDAIKMLCYYGGKRSLIVDIRRDKVDGILKIFGEPVLNAPYTSTNDSRMTILILRIDHSNVTQKDAERYQQILIRSV